MASWNNDFKNWTFIVQGNEPEYDFPTVDEILKTMQEVREADLQPFDFEVTAVP